MSHPTPNEAPERDAGHAPTTRQAQRNESRRAELKRPLQVLTQEKAPHPTYCPCCGEGRTVYDTELGKLCSECCVREIEAPENQNPDRLETPSQEAP